MTAFSIGGTDIPGVKSYSGFDVAEDVKHLQLLGDGSSSYNEILQTTSLGMPRAVLSGVSSDADWIAAMEVLRRAHTPSEFVDPETTRTVIVEAFTKGTAVPATFLWQWSLSLTEVP